MTAPIPGEVLTAFKEKRHEIHLSGDAISKCIIQSNNDLPEEVYRLTLLNFLEISSTPLQCLGDRFEKFKFLTNLALFSNQIQTVSPAIGTLVKLKYVDLSKNQIQSLPEEMKNLSQLQTLNVSQNELSDLPDFSGSYLVSVTASYNKFEELPQWLCTPELEHLSEVDFQHNSVKGIPSGLSVLPVLKKLNLESNQVVLVPGELGDALKLKELLLKDNKLKDNRLRKLVEGKPKSVMDYVKKNCPRNLDKPVEMPKPEESSGDTPQEAEDGAKKDTVIILPPQKSLQITVMNSLNKIRPFLVCCILKNVDLRDEKMKKFITLQNKLHDGICGKRVQATIATHDLRLVHGPLVFAARAPDDILVRPLNRKKDVSAREYVDLLKDEAEKRRKELKRTSYSGVHQYLSLLRPWQRYPCLIDGSGTVISFPPITNSDVTRISNDTQDILVEVTSSANLAICKNVMDTLVLETLKLGLGNLRARPAVSEADFPTLPTAEPQVDRITHLLKSLSLEEASIDNVLLVEQCRVLAEDESLKVAYPAKPDLVDLPAESGNVEVKRAMVW